MGVGRGEVYVVGRGRFFGGLNVSNFSTGFLKFV
jgi:hypothetical protein